MEISRKRLRKYMRQHGVGWRGLARILKMNVGYLKRLMEKGNLVLNRFKARRLIYAFGVSSVLDLMCFKNEEVMRFESEYRAAHTADAH